MKIAGVQKTTLIDYPDQIASVIFTQGCNFNCPYCHNPELIPEAKDEADHLSIKDLWGFLKGRKDLIDGVCITGGEPTLQADLKSTIEKIKKVNLKVKLDTNGTKPAQLKELIDNKLINYIAMDVKAPLSQYNKFTSTSAAEKIITSIKLIKNSNLKYEFRTTVVPGLHTADDIEKISKEIKGANLYYLQNFNPTKTLNPKFQEKQSFPPAKLEDFKKIAANYVKKVKIRN